jgi:hypothetical protein
MKLTSTLISAVVALTLSGTALTGCTSESTGDTGDTGDTTDTTTNEAQAITGKELVGHWVSKGCEAYPNGQGGENYLTRDFTLTEKGWDLKLVIFGDEACSYPLFTADITGPFTLGELSEKVEGATEGDFGFETIEWTAHDQGMAETFTMSGCGTEAWEVGKPQDVTGTGCIGVAHAVSECPVDHDVVSVDGDELFFGERVTDMCKEEGRPAALGAYPVIKQ